MGDELRAVLNEELGDGPGNGGKTLRAGRTEIDRVQRCCRLQGGLGEFEGGDAVATARQLENRQAVFFVCDEAIGRENLAFSI